MRKRQSWRTTSYGTEKDGKIVKAAMQWLQLGYAWTLACYAPAARLIKPQTEGSPLLRAAFEKEYIMAAIQTTRPAPFGANSTFRVLTSASAILSAVRGWNDARVTRKALSKLSNRELDDIGLCRGDVERMGR